MEKPQELNAAIKTAYEEEATFDVLKVIGLLNLKIKKTGLPEILNCVRWCDYTGTVENPTLPTMGSYQKDRWRKVKETRCEGGSPVEKQADRDEWYSV